MERFWKYIEKIGNRRAAAELYRLGYIKEANYVASKLD